MDNARIGIIGGSGLYDMEGLEKGESVLLETPFGTPSERFQLGTIDGSQVVFLPRHGKGHTLLPGEIPFRANIFGMKKLGVDRIISVSSVGSMKEHVHPCDIVIPDQFIDRTRGREDTFFGDGVVAHISFADPVCPALSRCVADVAENCGANIHRGGTYVCIEGPAFSTRAESNLYRSWGVDVIGMTNYQEARLAREAQMCYCTIACVTDYDCWNESEGAVSVEMLIDNLKTNTAMACEILRRLVPRIGGERDCMCANALKSAILTAREDIPRPTLKKLQLIMGSEAPG